MNLAPIIREALDIWQNPPFTALSADAIVGAANRCLSQYNLDLDLTPNVCFATLNGTPFTFSGSTAREVQITDPNILDISRILRVESRNATSTSDDDWDEEKIASYENWDTLKLRGGFNYVSFYRNEDVMKMVVARNVASLEFRLIYKTIAAEILTNDADVILPDVYKPMVVYDLALEFAEIIDDLSPEFAKKKQAKMPWLVQRYEAAASRIDKWRRSQRGTGPVVRRAFNERSSGTVPGRRRFTVSY